MANPLSGFNFGNDDNDDEVSNIPTLPDVQQKPVGTSALSGFDFSQQTEQPVQSPAQSEITESVSPVAEVAATETNPITDDDRAAGRFESAGGGFVQGLGNVAAGAVRGAGEIGAAISEPIFQAVKGKPSGFRVDQSPIVEAGNKIESFFAGITDINPEFQDTNFQTVATGLGSAAGFIAGGSLGAVAKVPAWLGLGVLGVTAGADQQVQDYISTVEKQGGVVNVDLRGKAALLGGALGSVEAIPFTKALKRLEGATGGLVSDLIAKKIKGKAGRVLGEAFQGGIEEFTQEAIQQAGTNFIASGLLEYDPERNEFKGVGESAAAGGQVGFILNGLMSSIGLRKGGRFEQITQEDSVRRDVAGLDATEDDIRNIARDTKGKTALPLSEGNVAFQDKGTRDLLDRYINLAQLRRSQEDRGVDLARVNNNISQVVESITEGTALNEQGQPDNAIKSQESDEVLRFITRNESIATDRVAPDDGDLNAEQQEDIDIGDLSTRRKGFISSEAKANAKVFQDFLKTQGEAKGFNVDNVVEEIDVSDVNGPTSQDSVDTLQEEISNEVDPLTADLQEQGVSQSDIEADTLTDTDVDSAESLLTEDTPASASKTMVQKAVADKVNRTAELAEISVDTELLTEDLNNALDSREPNINSDFSETTSASVSSDPSDSQFISTDTTVLIANPSTTSPVQTKLNQEVSLDDEIQSKYTALSNLETEELKGNKAEPGRAEELKVELAELNDRKAKATTSVSDENVKLSNQSNLIDEQILNSQNTPNSQNIDALTSVSQANLGVRNTMAKGMVKTLRQQPLRSSPVSPGLNIDITTSVSGSEAVQGIDTMDNTSNVVENAPIGLDRDSGLSIGTDTSNPAIQGEMKSYTHNTSTIVSMAESIDNVISKINKETKDKLVINHITELSQITDPTVLAHINSSGRIPMGLHVPASESQSGKAEVYTFAGKHKNSDEVIKTFMHEVVGHFGMSGLLGNQWNGFLKKAYTAPGAADRIFNETHKRWSNIIKDSPLKKGEPSVVVNETTTSGVVKTRISETAMTKLTDEHIANIAARFSDTTFRKSLTKKDSSLFKRALAKIRHFLGKIGIRSNLSQDNLTQVVSKSFNSIFNDPLSDYDFSVKPTVKQVQDWGFKLNEFDTSNDIQFSSTLTTQEIKDTTGAKRAIGSDKLDTITPRMAERLVNVQLNPEETARSQGVSETDIQAINRLQQEGFGSVNTSVYQRQLTRVGNRIAANPIIARLSPLNNLTLKKEYRRITNKQLGQIEVFSAGIPERVGREFKDLNAEQKQNLYNFYTTKDAVIEDDTIPVSMQDLARDSKNKINELSKTFRDNGMLSDSAFNENLDSYLPRRFLAFLDQPTGRGKQASFQSYLKKKNKELPDEIRASLGEIKDPAFLVSETIHTLSRDAAIISMFDTLNKTNDQLGLDWVLSNGGNIEVPGKTADGKDITRKFSLSEADARLKQLDQILKGDDGLFLRTDEQTAFVVQEKAELEAAIDGAVQREDAALLEAAKTNGVPEDQLATYKADNYRQIPDQQRFGKLKGQWVRKEIFDDIQESYQVFEAGEANSVAKSIQDGLKRGHSFWKQMMVPLNAPSWIRNSLGNFVLLEMSTKTNSATLAKWTAQELGVVLNGKPSEYFTIVANNGGAGSTFSANELIDVRKTLKERMDKALKPEEESKLGKLFPMMGDQYNILVEFASKKHGLLEGAFKAVRVRDHLETWSKQNKQNWRKLESSEREVLIGEAMFQANQAIFDYGDVPSELNSLRRYPLGSPFITFMYKSFPQVIRSVARHPQKMVKYAAMGPAMALIFSAMNDGLDDDDYDRLTAGLPKHVQERKSSHVLPWKNGNGDFQYMDFSFMLPWGVFQDMAHKAVGMFDTDSPGNTIGSVGAIATEMTKDLGLLGGPVPSMVTSFLTGVDDFTKRPIMTEGAPKSQQYMEMVSHQANMWLPSFMSDNGTLGRMLNNLGIDAPVVSSGKEKSFTGRDKETGGQVLASLAGFNTKSFSEDENRISNTLAFQRRERAVQKFMGKVKRNQNLSNLDRITQIREATGRLKAIKEERRKFLEKTKKPGA